ncbi:hypothetical protein NF701_08560 [Sphingomonadaceae bacterium OTU29THOMA1]|nr:hypothetical protein NF701_08560 [Sphingomonadaceae bacterium OTU29THOMA1]
MSLMIALLLQTATTAASVPLPGVWAMGETANCASGEAWVFTADGYYVELTLPDGAIDAVGVWADKGNAIDYTHAHAPFSDLGSPQQRRTFRITSRSNDRIKALNYKNERRVLHRCPAGAIKPHAK